MTFHGRDKYSTMPNNRKLSAGPLVLGAISIASLAMGAMATRAAAAPIHVVSQVEGCSANCKSPQDCSFICYCYDYFHCKSIF